MPHPPTPHNGEKAAHYYLSIFKVGSRPVVYGQVRTRTNRSVGMDAVGRCIRRDGSR
ncbi:hypothetical protein QWM81_20235 [Streptomyces ficellus]|uniref:Uncharacterized protein n=1 Tax=Streptomyces ficellus TaxID=1977088 RepID=A0ABT7ZA84_9ACTN|nr:hypothetical protein [Streptomyces ficellus]MDN3296350.1 hypothetical protein [Streptomyces ficellus]